MVAQGGANEVSATLGTRSEKTGSPGGAAEPPAKVLPPLRGFISIRIAHPGLRPRGAGFTLGYHLPPLRG